MFRMKKNKNKDTPEFRNMVAMPQIPLTQDSKKLQHEYCADEFCKSVVQVYKKKESFEREKAKADVKSGKIDNAILSAAEDGGTSTTVAFLYPGQVMGGNGVIFEASTTIYIEEVLSLLKKRYPLFDVQMRNDIIIIDWIEAAREDQSIGDALGGV